MKVEIEFTEPLLGTRAGNKELATEYQASKHPDQIQEDEADAIENIDEKLEKSSTVFDRDEERKPFLWDYQIKGFFKAACRAMRDTETHTKKELEAAKLRAYKKTIDTLIFVKPRRILLQMPDGAEMSFCERPLRGQTVRGERISLARSEEAPAGTKMVLEILTMNKKLDKYVEKWLEYGSLYGLGQWRNSGKGRFKFKLLKE